jgi:ribose-phosphate pyrophosphokinase
MDDFKIFAGFGDAKLANEISKNLNISLGEIDHKKFPSGESYCQFKTNIRGVDTFLIQSDYGSTDSKLMELLIMSDAARRASASRITAILPMFPYQRQDRKDKSRTPISSKLVMDLLNAAGINRIVTMDLHSPQIVGFTNFSVDQLIFKPTLLNCLKDSGVEIDVVVAPDVGAVKRSQDYAETLGKDLAIIAKKRISDVKVEVLNFVGNVSGKKVLIVDDLTESVGTLTQAAKTCWNNGASEVNVAVTHPCFSEKGIVNLIDSIGKNVFTRFFYSNTVSTDWYKNAIDPLSESIFEDENVICVDVAPVFATAIRRIHNNESVSELFEIV